MDKKHGFGFLFFLIVSIVILFTAMLVLCGMYLDLRVNGVTSSLPSIPENDKWILTDSSYNARSSSVQLISPVFMGIKTDVSGMIAATYDENARENLSALIEPKMMALFNGSAEKAEFEDDAAKEAFLKEIIGSDTYIYMSFYESLPANAILTGFYGNGNYSRLNEVFDVKYLFILPDGNSVKGVCLDGELNAWILHANEETAFDQSVFYAYNEVSGFAEFEFVSDTIPVAVFTESFDVNSPLIVPSFSFYNFSLSDSNTVSLLKALDFNPNLVKTYTYNDNSFISFVGEEKELYVSFDDQTISYNGYNGGIHLSEYLKYYPLNVEYTFNDTLLAVKYLINSIDRILVGGDAVPSIVGISHSAGETVFKLKYFYNGITITDKAYDILVAIEGEYIKRIEIGTVFCDGGNLTVPVIPQKLAMGLLDESLFEENFAGLNAIFVRNEVTGETELVWTLRKDEK